MDDRDSKILAALEMDSRISVAALARQVNLSPTAIRQRLKRLEKEGEIQGYTILRPRDRIATQDTDNLMQALVILRLKGAYCKKLRAAFGHYPEIIKFWSLAGEIDAAMILSVTHMKRLSQLTEAFNDHPLVEKIQSHMIINTHLDR